MVHAQSIDSATLYIIHNKAFCPMQKVNPSDNKIVTDLWVK